MKCVYCNSNKVRVIDSREIKERTGIRRRRECITCKKRFTTYELPHTTLITVRKRDGRIEPFDKEKIINGLIKATSKSKLSREMIEKVADKIEFEIQDANRLEIDSEEIGGMILKKLSNVDEVAYIRFLSVYKSFKNINEFYKNIENFIKKKLKRKKTINHKK
jgi:transcriptional repressor NrdR